MPAEPNPHAEFIAHYRDILDRLLERGSELTRALKHATRPSPVVVVATPAPAFTDVAEAYHRLCNGMFATIRLDLRLPRARPGELNAARLARIIDAICRDFDAAAALLPGAASPFPHADSAALRARANRLAARPASGEILPFPRPRRARPRSSQPGSDPIS